MAVESEQAVGDVGECFLDAWCGSVVDMLRVFVPDGVADVVAFVIDPPLVSDVVVKVDCCGVFDEEAGDDERPFLPGFLTVEVVGSASNAGGLSRVWKSDVVCVCDPGSQVLMRPWFRSRTAWSGVFLTSGSVLDAMAEWSVGWCPLAAMM
ncbi:hypothetical protein [Actinocrispum wychmicini]|uniref:hypothetical protein n=1 Tax=Actinocrispum wychmicini TaxID=1213861 RepID=UPI00104F1501|nr:hypothetical protein [Actinocrispum wychmicini]